jgi:hypothetical protein
MSWRKIVVDGIEWKYEIGRGSVIARSEYGDRLVESLWRVKGSPDPHTFERGQDKLTSAGAITPSDVANWIKRGIKCG